MAIEVVRGHRAWALLGERSFRERWSGLYQDCPWSTPFQSCAFLVPWYQTYRDRFDPVLVIESDNEGELKGLLALALVQGSERLVMAGTHQAEYQVWLAAPGLGQSFAAAALRRVGDEMPCSSLSFKYLPPGVPLEWTAGNGSLGFYCELKAQSCPVMEVKDGHRIAASLRKKQNRSRLHRLERLGALRLETIREPAGLAPVLDDIAAHYDLRQGAINGNSPFQQDPFKKAFLLALMETPGVLDVSLLRAGERIVSAHLGVCGRGTVHLGVFAHSPFAAEESPGKLHLLMLGERLNREGAQALDLTPGGDEWKGRFATNYEEVHTLTAFFKRWPLVRHGVQQAGEAYAKRAIRAIGFDPASIRRCAAKVRHIGLTARLRRVWDDQEFRVYATGAEQVRDMQADWLMKRDHLEDLLCFDPPGSGLTRQQFLAHCLRYLAKSFHVYTHVHAGRLVHYAWLAERQDAAFASEVEQRFSYPQGSAIIFDVYTHPQACRRGLFQASIRQMTRDAVAFPGTCWVYTSVLADDGPSRHVIEKSGFSLVCSLFRKKRPWVTRTWRALEAAGGNGDGRQ